MKNLISVCCLISLFFGCENVIESGELCEQYLEQKNLIADHTIDAELTAILPDINCILKPYTSLYFVDAAQWDQHDTRQVLIIPFRKKNGEATQSGFSDLSHRVVFLSPLLIRNFVDSNSIGDSSGIGGYLGILLLHEIGHFILNVTSYFDAGTTLDSQIISNGGNISGKGRAPMTLYKKEELAVDSLAIEMVKNCVGSKDRKCFSQCFDIEMTIIGAEFILFGRRIINNFGTLTPKFIRDEFDTHPNMELRLAFMNYYLNPTVEKKQQIDEYVYEREMAPTRILLFDSRTYQSRVDSF